ncbi:MAG TPA: hypothetical protein RMH99_03130 [Sandaracinaceae bacterium LLY-WYZ-13_1]|nr:hypothetical protein [Sandaracinaceae bacterium LLY-WYZ-13_1]
MGASHPQRRSIRSALARLPVAGLVLFTVGAGGCYLSHERGDAPGGGTCRGVEAWRYEDRGSAFSDAIADGSRRHVFGIVERDGHGLWTFGSAGDVQRAGPIGESRAGAILGVDGELLIAGRMRRTWRLERFDPFGAEVSSLELALESEEGGVTALVPAADAGAVFAVGNVSSAGSGQEIFVVRATAAAIEWSRSYGGEHRAEDRPIGAFVDRDGRLVVLAQRWRSGGGGPFRVFAVDPDGDVAWDRLGDVGYARDSTWSFVPLDDGALLVGNPDAGPGADRPARAIRLDRVGSTRWQTDLDVDGSGRQSVVNDALVRGDRFVLVGYSAERTAGMIWGLGADGSLDFERSPEIPAEGTTTSFTQVEPFGDGYLVAGDRQWDGPTSWLFVRTDAEGRPGWVLEPPYDGRAPAPRALVGTRDGEGALAVGTAFPGEGRVRGGLALELTERCD